MSNATAGQKAAFWMSLVTLILALAAGWFFLAPLVFPVFRWQSFDLAKINAKAETKQQLKFKMRYHPRGEGDPVPWQIISCEPGWDGLIGETDDDPEDGVLIRVHVVSDRTGDPPSSLFIASTYKDRYFRGEGWRLPAGTFGKRGKRPVVLMIMDTWTRLEIGEAQNLEFSLNERSANDDEWEGRADGFHPPKE